MAESEMVCALREALDGSSEFAGSKMTTFEDAGLLTMNQGLIVRLDDSEYQLTVVRSR